MYNMTTHFILDGVRTGLTKVLKDISTTYSLDFEELSSRYLPQTTTKRPKRQGHISTYNVFVKEFDRDGKEFNDVAKEISQAWKNCQKDTTRMKALEAKRDELTRQKNGGEKSPVVEKPAQSKKSTKGKGKGKGKQVVKA